MSQQIIEILGKDPQIYTDVLSHVIMRTFKIPEVVELMENKNYCCVTGVCAHHSWPGVFR